MLCFIALYMYRFVGFCLKKHRKGDGRPLIKWRGKTLQDLNYADDLSILDDSTRKMNELLDVLRVQGARIGLKVNVKKTKSLRLGISEDENGQLHLFW